MNNTLQQQLYWRSRRGLKELDLLLIPFIEQEFPHLNTEQQQTLIELLEASDPELYSWLLGYTFPPNKAQQALCEQIRQFHQRQHSISS